MISFISTKQTILILLTLWSSDTLRSFRFGMSLANLHHAKNSEKFINTSLNIYFQASCPITLSNIQTSFISKIE